MILAAGMGSRYGGIKQIEPVGPHGELIIDYSIYDAMLAGFDRVVFVIRKDIERDFCDRFFNRISKEINATYVFQEMPVGRKKPWGTTHAILAAKEATETAFCVINADDFYGRTAFKKMADFLKSAKGNNYASVCYKVARTLSDQGTVSRGVCEVDKNNMITEINERLKVYRKDRVMGYTLDGVDFYPIRENSDACVNFFGFTTNVMPLLQEKFDKFMAVNATSEKAEYQVSIATGELIKEGRVTMKMLTSNDNWLGFTYPEDKEIVKNEIKKLEKKGIYPSPLWR